MFVVLQSSSDITQIRELQAELEDVKKERQSLQEQVRLNGEVRLEMHTKLRYDDNVNVTDYITILHACRSLGHRATAS